MSLSKEDTIQILARLCVLEHVVSVVFRENAIAAGKTAEDVSLYAEQVKQFIESENVSDGLKIHITAAVDRLFQQIAADIRTQEN